MSHLNVANNANRPIQCIALPHSEWMCRDTVLSDVLIENGNILKTSSSGFIDVYKEASRYRWCAEFEQAVTRLFETNGDKVYPGEVLDVFNTSFWDNPSDTFCTSQTGKLFGYAASVTLLLRTDCRRYACVLETTNDAGWIILKQDNNYVAKRAKQGHLWIPEHNGETHCFESVRLKENSTAANFQYLQESGSA